MKRLLIVAPTFPPHPSPATHRARFLARYGAQNGWHVEVLSVRPEFYEEELDEELVRLVPPDLVVRRTAALSPRWTRRLGIGDIGIRAYFPMRRELRRLCHTAKPDLLFIPGGPFYTFLLGADIWSEFGVPYVLDYTDPWVFPLPPGENHIWRKMYWSSRLARWLEPRAVRHASHVLSVSEGTNDGIRASYPDLSRERFSAVPFGFEASDFDALRAHPRANPYWDRDDGNLHLVYLGAMLPHGYDVVRALFAAILQLRDETPALVRRLRLHFIGTTYDPKADRGLVAPIAQEMGIGAIVDEHPKRIPYVDALNVLTASDGILALGSSLKHYTASKIFPCILARRPLLAIYHEASSVCDIITRANAGRLVTYSDDPGVGSRAAEIAEAMRGLVAEANSPGRPDVRFECLQKYSAETMSRHIFEVFDSIVDLGVAPETSARRAVAMHA